MSGSSGSGKKKSAGKTNASKRNSGKKEEEFTYFQENGRWYVVIGGMELPME